MRCRLTRLTVQFDSKLVAFLINSCLKKLMSDPYKIPSLITGEVVLSLSCLSSFNYVVVSVKIKKLLIIPSFRHTV